MREQLNAAFNYADEHRWSVGSEWFGLFTDEKTYGTFDEYVSRTLEDQAKSEHPLKRQRRSQETLRAVVVVVDEARSLLENGRTILNRFQDALGSVKSSGVIFGVFVDTNPEIMVDSNAVSVPSSQEKLKLVFPPLILTQSMDIFLAGGSTCPFDYKASVLLEEDEARREILLRMGRPLWDTFGDGCYPGQRGNSAAKFASSKLLCDLPPCHDSAFGTAVLHGVAGLLCRLGLRLYARVGSLLVANCMATLHH